ncbi:MAG TPA: RDD family protein [Anaerolineales bacterium]|nr:RDD family protein [Anaerolineales bacterium]
MLNNTDTSQQSIVQESIVEQTGQEINPEAVFTFPPIAGFWRRFFAWLIDSLLLGVIGQVIAVVFSSFFFSIGPYGRPIGLLFIIPYFGILNSKIGGGQTIGKRLLKIAVRNKNNEPIELGRSLIRISLLALPALFNGWPIPILQNYVMVWFLSLLVFGLGGAIFYTMIFNRKARQGIHDLLLGTYVVHLPGKPIEFFPTTARIHWIVTSLWIGIVAISTLAMVFVAPSIISKIPLASAKSLYDILQEDPRFFTVGVNDQTFYSSNGNTSRSLNITVWYKGKISENEREKVVNSIVKTVLDNEKNINDYDGIKVNITSAYDIGIAKGHLNFWVANSIEGWKDEVYPNGSPNGFAPFLMAKVLSIP